MNHPESQGHTWACHHPGSLCLWHLNLSTSFQLFCSLIPITPVLQLHWDLQFLDLCICSHLTPLSFLSSLLPIFTHSLAIILESIDTYSSNASSLMSLLLYQVSGAGKLTKYNWNYVLYANVLQTMAHSLMMDCEGAQSSASVCFLC